MKTIDINEYMKNKTGPSMTLDHLDAAIEMINEIKYDYINGEYVDITSRLIEEK